MSRYLILSVLFLGVAVGLQPARSAPAADRLRSYDAEATAIVVDRQGVRTELTAFGRLFGPGFISGYLGDAHIQVPWEKVQAFRVGVPDDRLAPMDVHLVGGGTMHLLLEPTEFNSVFAGNAAFGYFRISLGKIASCEIRRDSRESGLGRRCPHGHLFYNSAWRFCPYDGKPLKPIVGDDAGEVKGGR